jgi:predicted transporter
MIEAILVTLGVGIGLGYGFRGLINKNIKTVGSDVKTSVNTAASDITKKL